VPVAVVLPSKYCGSTQAGEGELGGPLGGRFANGTACEVLGVGGSINEQDTSCGRFSRDLPRGKGGEGLTSVAVHCALKFPSGSVMGGFRTGMADSGVEDIKRDLILF